MLQTHLPDDLLSSARKETAHLDGKPKPLREYA